MSRRRLNADNPDIRHDLDNPLPRSAPGFLVRALQARRAAGIPPFTVLCCDNLPENGHVVRGVVLDLARLIDPDLAAWIEAQGAFPSTMVDRIVPATTPADLDRVETLTGRRDEAPVMHEPFRQWVVEDRFCAAVARTSGAVGVTAGSGRRDAVRASRAADAGRRAHSGLAYSAGAIWPGTRPSPTRWPTR